MTHPGSGSSVPSYPAPIVPIGASDPPRALERPVIEDFTEPPDSGQDPAPDSEVAATGETNGPRLLEYLSIFFVAETVLSVFVVVGAIAGLNEDHRGVGPLSQDPYWRYTGLSSVQYVVFVAALVLLATCCGFGAWTAFHASRADPAAESRKRRIAVAAWLAQAAVLPAAIVTFAADSTHGQWGAASSVALWPNVLTGWAWLALDALGAFAICAFCVGLQARRKDLLPKPRAGAILGVILAIALTVFATLSLSTGLDSATGFWSTSQVAGPSDLGTFPVVESVSCAGNDCFAVAAKASNQTESFMRIGSGKAVVTSGLRNVREDGLFIACASVTSCFVYGTGTALRTTDGGETFDRIELPGGISSYVTIRCDAPDRCYAFDSGLFAISTDEGARWRVLLDIPTPKTRGPVHEISSGGCPTAADCFAIGSYGSSSYAAYTTDGGLHWGLATGAPDAFLEVLADADCVSRTTCFAEANSTRIVTTDAGRSWSTKTPQIENTPFEGCPSQGTCVRSQEDPATKGYAIYVTDDGGGHWRVAARIPTGYVESSHISCDAGGTCAVAFAGFGGSLRSKVAVTTDYGAHWKLFDYP